MKKRILAVAALALPLAVSSAYAQDSTGVRISGFGTGALTWSNNDQAEFSRPNQASGVKKDPRTGVDSNLGLQADYAYNDWLSFTGQGLVRKDGEDNYGAELTWAFVKAKLSSDVSVRVGRMALPAFMISDYRNVGYASTFLRPPSEVYSQVPLNNIDGVDITWQHGFGDTTLTAQLAAGHSTAPLTNGADASASGLTSLALTAEHGPFTLRFGRTDGKISVESASLNTLVNTFNTVGNAYKIGQLNDMAHLIDNHHKKGSFTSIGLGLDWNNVVGQTEYAKRKIDSTSGSTNSWYVLGGYRFGKFLPYYSHADLKASSDFTNTVPSACAAGFPAACTATVRTLRATLESLRTSTNNGAQNTDSIGLRWDFMSSADIKFQIDRVKPDPKGLFTHVATGFHGPVTVGAVSVDFVF
jgi:hypothetical protein